MAGPAELAPQAPEQQTTEAKEYSATYIEENIRAAQGEMGPFVQDPRDMDTDSGWGTVSLIGIAYICLNSWTAMASSLSLALPSGGPSVVVWGILPSFLGSICTAASLAEILHTYPTAGGQYHFAYLLAPTSWAPLVAWFNGWFAVAGWWALFATAPSLAAQLVTGLIALQNPDYSVEPWHVFLVYLAFTIGSTVINVFGYRLLPAINRGALFWSLVGAATISVVGLATAGKRVSEGNAAFQPASFVFGSFINETGWPDGVSWILGLLQSSFGLTAFDGVMHMTAEMSTPHITAPKVMIAAVIIGSASSFIFLVVLLFCITDVDVVISSPNGALLEAMHQASGTVGATALQMFPIVSMGFAANGILTATSRMTLAFAEDGGLPFSPFFARMHPSGVPRNAVYLSSVLCVCFGLIYLGSSSALNAILSSSVVFLNISYSMPIAFLLVRGRHLLRPESFPAPTLSLGPVLGPICNIVGISFTIITTIFFLFPPSLPVTGQSMNYAVVVLAMVIIVASVSWGLDGRKNYRGPRNMGGMLELARTETNRQREKRDETESARGSKEE